MYTNGVILYSLTLVTIGDWFPWFRTCCLLSFQTSVNADRRHFYLRILCFFTIRL